MNVRIEKIASLVLVSLMIFGLMAMHIETAAAQDPALPFLYVAVSGNTADIYLMGEGFTDLDEYSAKYWNITGLDIVLRFDASAMQAVAPSSPEEMIDPEGWFTFFWPEGIVVALPYPGYTIDNVNGYVRMVILGLPGRDDNGNPVFVPPNGQGRIMSVTFDNPITTPIRLEKLPPERPALPGFGPEYFALDIAQFGTAMPIPFVGGPAYGWHFTVSNEMPLPYEDVTFQAVGYHPDIISLYEWDFESDGIYDATGPTVVHAFSTSGFHKTTLRVTEYLGNPVPTYSARILCDAGSLLKNGKVEHRLYRVSTDEDMYNTLYLNVENSLGSAAGDVKAVFSIVDKRTGMSAGADLTATGVVAAYSELSLSANFDPSAYGYEPGTSAHYATTATLSYLSDFTDSWIPVGTFYMPFKIVP